MLYLIFSTETKNFNTFLFFSFFSLHLSPFPQHKHTYKQALKCLPSAPTIITILFMYI